MEINGIIIKFKPMEKGNIIMLLLIQGILPSFIFLKTPFLIRLLIIRKNFYLVRHHLRMMFHHATD